MSQKSKILITFVFLISIAAIGLALIIVLSLAPTEDVSEPGVVSFPVSSPSDTNVITLEDIEAGDYKYAVITPEDTLAVIAEDGEELDINLAKNNWRELMWSPDGTRLSALGNEDGVDDLFLFDFESKEWVNYTKEFTIDFDVLTHEWIDETTIRFVGGNVPERWVHSVNVTATSEIIKLFKVQDFLVESTPSYYVFGDYDSNEFYVINREGQELLTIEDFKALTEEGDIQSVVISNQTIFISLLNQINQPRTLSIRPPIAVNSFPVEDVTPEILTLPFGFRGICTVGNSLIGYLSEDEAKQLVSVAITEEGSIAQVVLSERSNSFLPEDVDCLTSVDRILFADSVEGERVWSLTSQSLEEIESDVLVSGNELVIINPTYLLNE